MSKNATILYDVQTSHWPPDSFAVQLDPPLRRYNVETGDPIDYEHVIVTTKAPARYGDGAGADVFPAVIEDVETDDGVFHVAGFVNDTMIPLSRFDYGVVHSILTQMGYTATN